ncbi:hypothetical protein CRG98_024878 [Punica granatum]|nr:hypothetical protein CRG98_024878 [Punica granatum]
MSFLLLLVFLVVVDDRVLPVRAVVPDGSMRFELVREHGPDNGGAELQHTRELLQRDVARYRMISQRRRVGQSARRKTLEQEVPSRGIDCVNETVSMDSPMISGRDYGIGQYVVQVKVGTPPKKFRLIADLGSELTWVRCHYDQRRPRHRRHGVFLPANSSTFTTIPCSSRTCKVDLMNLFSLTRCPIPSAPCAYDFRYLDGSAAVGIFAEETITARLTNGHEMKMEKVLIGCSESIRGPTLQAVDGVLGLAYTRPSFTATAARRFDGKFSYCLVDHLSHKNVRSHLTFGNSRGHSRLLAKMRYTNLVLGGAISPLYGVDISGISIGGKLLDIPRQVWAPNSGGGVIMDSGTSLTFLAAPAYQQVIGPLKASLSRYMRVNESVGPMEYCFDSTGFEGSHVSRLVIHFEDGARFEPPVKSYVIDVAPGIKCIGLLSAKWPSMSIIGNIMQQNHFWEFDLAEKKLGFAPSSCT